MQGERGPQLWGPLAEEEVGPLGLSRKRAPEVIQGLKTLPTQIEWWGNSVYLLGVIHFSIIY